MRRALLRAVVTAAVVAAGVLPGSPAHADSGTITTVAGGPGSGAALDLGQRPRAVALTETSLWLVDETTGFTKDGLQLRVVDLASGVESAPLLSLPSVTFPTVPSLASTPDGGVVLAYGGVTGGSRIVKVTRSGVVTPLAGGGNAATAMVDGLPGTLEALGQVRGVAVDADGVVYFTESNVHQVPNGYTTVAARVRKISTGGRLLPVAGLTPGFAGDGGPALKAKLDNPSGLAIDPAGDLYVADTGNGRIRKITTSSAIPAISAVTSASTTELAYDSGSLFWIDTAQWSIRRLSPTGLSTVVGDGTLGIGAPDGPAAGRPASPLALAARHGSVVFSEYPTSQGPYAGHVVSRVDLATGLLARVVGSGREQLGGDGGPALQAQVDEESPIVVDAAGRTYLGDLYHLRRIELDGTIRTVAGSGFSYVPTGMGGQGTDAAFDTISAVALSPTGEVYFAVGLFNSRILAFDPTTGVVSLVAGGGQQGSADGTPVTQANLGSVRKLGFDATGNLLYSAYFCTIRRLEPTGVLGTVPGTGTCAVTPDGPVTTSSGFREIRDFAVAPNGDLLVIEEQTYQGPLLLRRLSTSGVLTTLAGAGTSTADGVPATTASLPADAVTVDHLGRVVVAERFSGLVRRIDLDGTISTIAGAGSGPDGTTARTAALLEPDKLAVGPTGDLLITCRDVRTAYAAGVVRRVAA